MADNEVRARAFYADLCACVDLRDTRARENEAARARAMANEELTASSRVDTFYSGNGGETCQACGEGKRFHDFSMNEDLKLPNHMRCPASPRIGDHSGTDPRNTDKRSG